ncbi:MAG: rhamnosyltransferase [Planctomycetota bacterium]
MSVLPPAFGSSFGPVKSISVCLPVLNGDAFLERVLEGLVRQRCTISWEFLVVDCGSTDRTLELITSAAERMPAPVRVHGIHRSEFNHADTRNLLFALSDADLCVFLTDDAIPVGEDWLTTFASVFEDQDVWGAYLRNTPRPEADVLARSLSSGDEGYSADRRRITFPDYKDFELLTGDEKRTLFTYNDTASAVRRQVWERFPYPRCDFGEDVLLARGMLEGGGTVVYETAAVIHHSHEYEADVIRARSADDSAFNAQWLQRVLIQEDGNIASMLDNLLADDEAFLREEDYADERLKVELERARPLRQALLEGAREGSKENRRFTLGAVLAGARPKLRWCAAAGGLAAFEGLAQCLDQLRLEGWDVAEGLLAPEDAGPNLPGVQIIAGVDASVRGAFEAAAHGNQPTLVLVTPAEAESFGQRKAVVSAWELALPERVPSPPFANLWLSGVTHVPLELFIWRTADQLDELRGARQSQVNATEERRRVLPVRLRGLAARSLRARPHISYDEPGTLVRALHNGARILDPTRVLIPWSGAAEWDITSAGTGHRVLLIQVECLGDEPEVLLGGRAKLNDEPFIGLGTFRIIGDTEWRVYRLPLMLKPGRNILRLEGLTVEGIETILRVLRVVLLDLAPKRRHKGLIEDTFDLRGHDGELKAGPRGGELQDCDQVLLGPKSGAVEFAVDGHVGGDYELRLVLHFTAEETTLVMHGRLLVDGVATARIGPVQTPEGGGNVELRFAIRLPGGRSVLRFENRKRPFGNLGFLRIRRLVLTPNDGSPLILPTPLQKLLQLPPRVGV